MRFLIAGFGSIGRRHFRNLRQLGHEDFVFLRTGRGTLPDDEVAGFPSETSLDAALSHRPDVAIVANPTSLHVPTALAAARAGCHLFIEKPLGHSLEGIEELASEVRASARTVMVGCQFRFHPLLRNLKEELGRGRLGAVWGARSEWGERLSNWHPWEDHRKSYSALPDLGGGVVLTLIHPLDYLYWLFGPVKRVKGASSPIEPLQTPVREDWAEIVLEFETGPIGQVHLDYWQNPPVHTLTVWGERGRGACDFQAGKLTWEVEGNSVVQDVPAGFERNAMFLDEMSHFLGCVARGADTDIPLDEGIAVLDMALRAKRSAKEGLGA